MVTQAQTNQELGFLDEVEQNVYQVVHSRLEDSADYPGAQQWVIHLKPLNYTWDNGKDGLRKNFIPTRYQGQPSRKGSTADVYRAAWVAAGAQFTRADMLEGLIVVTETRNIKQGNGKDRYVEYPIRVIPSYQHDGELPVRKPRTPEESGATPSTEDFSSQPTAESYQSPQQSLSITDDEKTALVDALDGQQVTSLMNILNSTPALNKSHIKQAAISGKLVDGLQAEGLISMAGGVFSKL